MTLPAQRPATARVLAALAERGDEDRWHAWATAYDLRVSLGCVERAAAPGAWSVLSAWRHADPGEAWEALQTAGLAPPDDAGRRWRCDGCGGAGRAAPRGGSAKSYRCGECGGAGRSPRPLDHAAMAAVASLGVDRWLRAEELARLACPGRPVEWRRMSAYELRVHHATNAAERGASLAAAFSLETSPRYGRGPAGRRERWPEACPHGGEHGPAGDVRRAWPCLRGLAAMDVHLVNAPPDADAVVLSAGEVA